MPLATGPGARPTPVPEDLTPAEFARLFVQTPEGAAKYLEGRKRLTQTFDWRALWQEEHAHQFTVSRLARLDLLSAIQDGITKSVGGDLTRRDFQRDTTKLLQEAGWWGKVEVVDPNTGEVLNTRFDPNRVKLIYDVNTRMAHSAGRWQRFQDSAKTHPYLRYITKGDERVRADHAAWNNVTLPLDDPFWHTHYPPCGWRCRCRAMAVSQAQYDAGEVKYADRDTGEPRVAPLDKHAPPVQMVAWIDKRTGLPREVPAGIDPGFGYNVGIAAQRAEELAKQVEGSLAKNPPDLAAAARQDGITAPAAPAAPAPALTQAAAQALDAARSESRWPENQIRPKHRDTKPTMAALEAQRDVPEVAEFLDRLAQHNGRVNSLEWHYFRYKYLYGDPMTGPEVLDQRMDRVLHDPAASVHPLGMRYAVVSRTELRVARIQQDGTRISVYEYTDADIAALGDGTWTLGDLMSLGLTGGK